MSSSNRSAAHAVFIVCMKDFAKLYGEDQHMYFHDFKASAALTFKPSEIPSLLPDAHTVLVFHAAPLITLYLFEPGETCCEIIRPLNASVPQPPRSPCPPPPSKAENQSLTTGGLLFSGDLRRHFALSGLTR